MCKKCICLCRVSTESQDLTAQIEKVTATAIADGYKRDEIAVVQGKESAIKLDEEERETLNEMKEIIANNPSIESVYVFAIDRLARRVAIVLTVKEYLLKRGINLVFLNPHKMGTLRKDEKTGEMVEDELTSLLLMLLSYGAEMEMKVKQARFNTAKAAMRANGKLVEGKPLFGYEVDTNNNIVINDKEAEAVRMIFDEYAHTEQSTRVLYSKLVARGVVKEANTNTAVNRILRIINDVRYSGRNTVGTTYYPAIVSEELQDEAIAAIEKHLNSPKSTHKHVYYCKGLIRNTANNHVMIAKSSFSQYYCPKTWKCMNLNVADSVAWHVANVLKQYEVALNSEEKKAAYSKQIEDNEKQIENINSMLETIKARQRKAFELFMKGKVSEELYDEQMSDINKDADKWSKQVATLESQSTHLKMMIEQAENRQELLTGKDILADVTDDEARREIILSLIDSVNITFLNDKKNSAKIEVIAKPELQAFYKSFEHYFIYYQSGGKMYLTKYIMGNASDASDIIFKHIESVKRPDRHKTRGTKKA